MKKFKNNCIILLLIIILFIFTSCSEATYQRIWTIRKTPVDIMNFNNIFISNFKIISDIDNNLLNKTMIQILKDELSIYHKNNLFMGETVNLSEKEIFKNYLFWREYAPSGDIIITGEINLDKKEREQIVSERETALSLKKVNRLQTVKIVITTVNFYIINAKTGKIIYKYKFYNKLINNQNDSDIVIINRVYSIAVERFLNRIVRRERINYRYLFNY
jgi:hypothetical protein